MSEIPVHSRPRRLVDWINPTGARKVHSLIDKVYQRKNLEMAWEMVKANRGSGGVDGQSLEGFAAQPDQQLDRLHRELKGDVYGPQPVRQVQIPKAGKPGEFRTLGIPIYDRVCQQALLNRLDPIFEPVFDEANFGYRRQHEPRMDDAFHPTPNRRQANPSPDPEMDESGSQRRRRVVGDGGRDTARGSRFAPAGQLIPTPRFRSVDRGMA